MRQKLVGMLLAMTMLGTAVLSGCGSSENGDSKEAADDVESTDEADDAQSTEDAEKIDTGEAAEIVIWVRSETHATYFEWVTAEYTGLHPEVTFKIEVMDTMDERLTIINQAGGEEGPDLMDIEQGAFSNYMSEDTMFFYPLNDYIEADGILDKMVESRLDLYKYDGNYYGLEHALCPVTMAYRVDLFEEYNLEVPTTWDEFKACAEVFAENGIYMEASKDVALGGDLAQMNMLTIAAGEDYVGSDGELNITDEWKTVVSDYIEMQQNGQMFAFEIEEEMWNMMADDKIATYFAADWAAGWLRDNVPEQSGLWKMAPMPKLTETSAGVSVCGGTGLCMSRYTDKDKDLLWDFMKFAMVDADNCAVKYEMISLYSPVYDAMEACNVPVEYYGDQNLGELWQSLADEIPAQNQAPWRSSFVEAFNANAYDLVEGNITMDEFVIYLTEAVDEYNAAN